MSRTNPEPVLDPARHREAQSTRLAVGLILLLLAVAAVALYGALKPHALLLRRLRAMATVRAV